MPATDQLEEIMDEQLLYFNGIDGASGEYTLPPLTPAQFSAVAQGEALTETDLAYIKELEWRVESRTHYGLAQGYDAKNLAESGWGVIFASNADPAIREALSELLEFRKVQAGDYYKEYSGPEGYRPDESKLDFLKRHKFGPGPVKPEIMPYYMLLVGDPEAIPYRFQYQLDVQFAVGRIYFESLDDYARYAHSVVEAEKQKLALPRRAAFFGVSNPDDPATNLSAAHLVEPLAQYLATDQPGWSVETILQDQATKQRLGQLAGGPDTPAFLFTASHGMSFPLGDPRQLPYQGALLCQDWPGPRNWRQAIPPEFYFSADDLNTQSRLFGLIAFAFACYGLGTPRLDEFSKQAFKTQGEIAPKAFLARLPQSLLAHPKGGALAVVGHVERAWGHSFVWGKAGRQITVFESSLKRLIDGYPIGSALEDFNERYAELSTELTVIEEDFAAGRKSDALTLEHVGLWTANNDARNYMILGDPAVRLMVAQDGGAAERPVLVEVTSPKPKETPAPAPQGEPPVIPAPTGIPTPPPAPELSAVDYGLMESFRQVQSNVSESLQSFVNKLGEFLSNALEDAASLEVATYVSEDMAEVKYEKGTFTGGRLRALTHIKIDGDTMICVPEEEGEVDTALWQIHMDMVQQAQVSRAELLKTAISAATGLVNLIKPGS